MYRVFARSEVITAVRDHQVFNLVMHVYCTLFSYCQIIVLRQRRRTIEINSGDDVKYSSKPKIAISV